MEYIKVFSIPETEMFLIEYSVDKEKVYPVGVLVLRAISALPLDNPGMQVNIVETLLECREQLAGMPAGILPTGELILHLDYEVKDAE